MPSLFRRKPTDLVEAQLSAAADRETTTQPAPEAPVRRGTPSKKELGLQTPKRPGAQRRPGGAAASKTPLTKAEAREQRRTARAKASAEYRTLGGPRDRGPERLLVRNIVDSRRTVGSYFLGGAVIVLLGSSSALPPMIRSIANILWTVLALAVIADSILICRKVKRLVRERFSKSQEKMGSLYMYAVMRALSFRRMRVPAPAAKIGDKP